MNKRNSSARITVLYSVGLLIGLYLIVIATWADMESAFYGFSRLADVGLRGFNCPVLMTSHETSTISLTVSNPTDGMLTPVIKTEISTSLVTQEYQESLKLAPGESKRLEWSVGPENIDLEHFIFAKTLVFSTYPIKSREASCGIFIVDLPMDGRVLLPILVVFCFLGMGFGLYGMNKQSASYWDGKYIRPMTFLAVVVGVGMVVSFKGGWVPSVLLLAVALLMTIILLGLVGVSERKKR